MPSSVLPRLGAAPLPTEPLPELPPAPVPGKGLARLIPNMRKVAKARPNLRLSRRPPVTQAVESAPAVQRQQAASRPAVRAQQQQAHATQAAANAQRAATTQQLRALREQRAERERSQAAPTPIRPDVEVDEAEGADDVPDFPPPQGGRSGPGPRHNAGDMGPRGQLLGEPINPNPRAAESEADRKRGGRGPLNAYTAGKMNGGRAPRSTKAAPMSVRRGRRRPDPTNAPVAPPDEAEAAPPAAPTPPQGRQRDAIRSRPRGLLEQMRDAFRARERFAERGQLAEARREIAALRQRLEAANRPAEATPEDLERLRQRMHEIVQAGEGIIKPPAGE